MKKSRLTTLCVLLLVGLPVLKEAYARDLTFGIYANEKATDLVKSFRPILDAIEKEVSASTGNKISIQMKVASSYPQGVEDLLQENVDFARFGPASYIEAKARQPEISIIAVETLNGQKSFRGIICVKEDSAIKSISELKGKRFAFGAQESTIGRYLAQDLLYTNGIIATDLAAYEFLGRHDKVAAAVAAGLFDAGAIKEDTYIKMRKQGQALREIASMENATKPWIARKGLTKATIAAIRKALLTLQDIPSLDEADGFALGEDKDYALIRNAMKSSVAFTGVKKD
ncbi:MAG: PhnD/SsuA/transferrin family substrate-binding protein [Gammaproteobacteria bacterium]|nr:PhnD/SsuA/transferrin family substrate-binding protein [Gammaproteobacteria bacterium]